MAAENEIDRLKQQILKAAKPLASTQGWLKLAPMVLAQKAKVSPEELRLCFPRLGVDLAIFYLQTGDQSLQEMPPPLPKSQREKIANLIIARISLGDEDKELARKTAALFALPPYIADGLSCVARTCDVIWRLAGDRAVDFSYYTKRVSLAAIYAQALIFYFSKAGEDKQAFKRFIATEIDVLMKMAKFFSFPSSKKKSA